MAAEGARHKLLKLSGRRNLGGRDSELERTEEAKS